MPGLYMESRNSEAFCFLALNGVYRILRSKIYRVAGGNISIGLAK